MNFVNKFYDYFSSVGVITFSLLSTTPPPPMKTEPMKVDGEAKLDKLGEDPEFKEIVANKKHAQAEFKNYRAKLYCSKIFHSI